MRKVDFKKIYLFLIGTGVFIAGAFLVTLAASSYQVDYGATVTVDEQGTCQKVTNNSSTGLAVFVPTNSSDEWSAFRTNLPSGVTLSNCVTWYDTSWGYRKKITIDKSKLSADVSSFPVLISLSSDSDLAARAKSDGSDIIFTYGEATSRLPRKIERYKSNTGELIAWVNVTSVSSSANTDIYLYYGNASGAETDATYVWDTNTKMTLNFEGDSGNTGHAITFNGDADINAATMKFGSGSMYFDGSGDYLTIPDHADWNFGGGNWTVDTWVRMDSDTGGCNGLFFQENGTSFMSGDICNSGQIRFLVYNGSSYIVNVNTGNSAFSFGTTWHHVAFVHTGGTYKIFVDGVEKKSVDDADNAGDYSTNFFVGYEENESNNVLTLTGYIDEFRVSNTARWTSGFTASSLPYGSDANTKLLLHFDGDSGKTGHAITFNGDADVNATKKKFGLGSMYFDGSGDYVTVSDHTDWDFGSGNFTVDFWVYPTSNASSGKGKQLIGQRSSDIYVPFMMFLDENGKIQVYVSFDNATWAAAPTITSTGALTLNSWTHIALVRNGNSFYLFFNGTQTGSTYSNSGTFTDVAQSLNMGGFSSSYNEYFVGYMDEMRISKGVARWTSNFTAPSSSYSPDAYTKLLLHFDEDETTANSTITMYGTPLMTGVGSKIGTSMYFDTDGTEAFDVPDSDSLDMGTGNFSVGMWAKYPSQTGGSHPYAIIFGKNVASSPYAGINIFASTSDWTGSDRLMFRVDNNNSLVSTSSGLNDSTWRHYYFVREGTTLKIYINGALDNSANINSIDVTNATVLRIASNNGATNSQNFLGYLDAMTFSSTNRTLGWILAEYNNQNSPATFYSLAAQETKP